MRRLGIVLLLCAAGCSSSHKAASPSTTVPPSFAESTTAPASTSSTTETTVGGSTSTTAAGVAIVSFSGPAIPIKCNAPTSVELHWRTTGTSVDLFIDGQKFASFKQPNFDGLEYFACNGNSHTYKLVAHGANGQTATKTITLY